MPQRINGNWAIGDIRILKILRESGPLSREELGAHYLAHMKIREMSGSVKNIRILKLMDAGYIKTSTRKEPIGLPITVYLLAFDKALEHYIASI